MITTFYPPYSFGGDGIFVQRLSNELARRGHRVDVIHSIEAYRLRRLADPVKGYADHPNVTVHGLESSSDFVSPLATQQMGIPVFHRARIQQILQTHFDVINYHNISLVGGPQVLRYGQGIKLYTIHEYWLVCPTHVLFRYNRAACTAPHCFLCSLTYRRPPQWWRYSGLLRDAVKHVDTFIAPSRFCIDIHRERGFDAPVAQLPFFVPPVELAPQSFPALADQSPYFLFVGRLEKLKGLHTLIPVFRRYEKARLLIAGRGSAEPALRRLAEGSKNIEFLGRLTEQQLQPLYRQAVAVIVPSLCFEAFPNVLLEAFRQQTPTVVRNLGALPEIVLESGGGVIYNIEAELVAALDRLLASPSFRRDLGLRGHAAYQKNWTAEVHLRRYFALIDEVAARKGERRDV